MGSIGLQIGTAGVLAGKGSSHDSSQSMQVLAHCLVELGNPSNSSTALLCGYQPIFKLDLKWNDIPMV